MCSCQVLNANFASQCYVRRATRWICFLHGVVGGENYDFRNFFDAPRPAVVVPLSRGGHGRHAAASGAAVRAARTRSTHRCCGIAARLGRAGLLGVLEVKSGFLAGDDAL